ncbi:MAG: hypothetical protein IH831_00445 [Planctomycetes bacterium]|nr:hypothetical protein [Planctomycetota bacterium]
MTLKVEASAAMVAFVITALFIVWPSPRLMAAFAFFAQPLFLIAAVLYGRRVFTELRRKKVL